MVKMLILWKIIQTSCPNIVEISSPKTLWTVRKRNHTNSHGWPWWGSKIILKSASIVLELLSTNATFWLPKSVPTLQSRKYLNKFCSSDWIQREQFFRNFIRLGVHDIGDITEIEVPNEKDCGPLCQDFAFEFIVHHQNITKDPYNNNIALIRLAKNVVFDGMKSEFI